MKVAIIHYWFITRRGGEKVVESILKKYPQADIYTLFYDPKQYGDHISNHKVYTSSLNNRFFRKHYQKLFPLYPLGIRSLKLREDYDLIISSESGPAKGIKKPSGTPHVCYIHSPMRYAWSHQNSYLSSVPALVRPLMKYFLNRLKKWDQSTVDNVHLYIANSTNVANRVKEFYKRDAEVVYPPIEEDLFKNELEVLEKEFYLSFGAITPYKKIDLLVETFNENGKPLVIIGEGSEKEKLKKIAKKNIIIKSAKDWKDIEYHIKRSKALLFPGEEDFGMIPLEVMSYGTPVIAFKKGGALETVVENLKMVHKSSGVFFSEQNITSLKDALHKFESIEDKFDPKWIRDHAFSFREQQFIKKFQDTVSDFLPKQN